MEQVVTYELDGPVALIGLNRPDKRNAIHPELQEQLHRLVVRAGEEAKCGVLFGHGKCFCSGLDLRWASTRWSDTSTRDPYLARADYRDAIGRGPIPFVAAIHGATLGGGLELASACHVRVGDETSYFGLPEGKRGIYIGGGGSVRVARIIGFSRMQDLMLTGRIVRAEEGTRWGILNYVVPTGQHLGKATELAHRIAENAPLTNFAVCNALPRLQDMSYGDGLWFERVVAEYVRSPETVERIAEFLDHGAPRVKPNEPDGLGSSS